MVHLQTISPHTYKKKKKKKKIKKKKKKKKKQKKKKKKKKKWKLISDYLLGKNNITKMWVLNTFY